MKELNLHLKIKKCKFGVSNINYLGMILSPGHIEMDPTKLNGIRNWPTLTKVKDVCSFFGFTNFYRRFISDYSDITHPLLSLTKKDTLLRFNLVRVEIRELRPEVIAESDEVSVHYRSRTNM